VTPAEAEALARNDRYLLEFVEANDLCPWARRCRESGGLERRVRTAPLEGAAELLPWLRELATAAYAHVEVALLIFPGEKRPFREWERLVAALRDLRAAEEPGPATFFCVAFHPEAPAHSDAPGRTVSLIRRSPDPTIQLVRASILDRVRGRDTSDTIFVDPRALDLTRPLPPREPSVSDRIAQANHDTVQRLGPEQVARQLAQLRRR
jgi:hypothetical protein